MRKPNKPDTPNAAMTSLFDSGRHWRGVGDPLRYCLMRTRRIITLGVLLTIPLVAFVLVEKSKTPTHEPEYEGIPLTWWLREVAYPPASWNGSDDDHPLTVALRAVRAIGTNGVPTFLRLIEARDSRLKIAMADLAEKQTLVRIPFRRAKPLNKFGLIGFQILGTNAQVAVPSLLSDLHAADPQLRQRASLALTLVGYTGAP